MHSLATLLDDARFPVPPPTASTEALGRALRALRHLPAVLSRQVHFEIPLDGKGERLDLILALDPVGIGVMAGANPVIRLARDRDTERGESELPLIQACSTCEDGLWTSPGWAKVEQLCRLWSEESLPAQAVLERLWIELDLLPGRDPLRSTPRIFVDLALESQAKDPSGVRALARYLHHEVSGAPDRRIDGRLDRLIGCLPDDATVYSLGVATEAESPRLRVCIRNLAADRWPELLVAADVPMGKIDMAQRIEGLGMASGEVHVGPDILHLDLAQDHPANPIGMEVGLGRRKCNPAPYLDHLAQGGMAPPDLGPRLQPWEGRQWVPFPHEAWPSRVDRRLNHIKVVFDGDTPPQGKAYLRHFHIPSPLAARRKASIAVARNSRFSAEGQPW